MIVLFRFRRTVAVAAGVLLAATSPSLAGVPDLLGEINSTLIEAGPVVAQMEDLTRQNENDLKAGKAIKSSLDQIAADVEGKTKAFAARLEEQGAPIRGQVTAWNNRCAVDIVGPLEEGRYNQCSADKAAIEGQAQAFQTRIKAEADQYQRQVIQPMVEIMQRQEAGLNEINTRIKARFDQWSKLDEKRRALKARIDSLQTRLASECRTAPVEEVKYCAAIGWDGQKGGLPTVESVSQKAAELCLAQPGLCAKR